MGLPLENLVVLDLTRVLAGPFCTMILGDLGANIIKVEMPNKGDDSREFGPFINGESAYYMNLNRNKRSMTLNLKNKKGKEIFKNILKNVDILVENFRPGTMEKLGLGYEKLKKINPKLIYAASSGFGHTGPYSKRPAYDGIVQAMGGIMSITGQQNGEPTKVGSSIGDIFAGVYTAVGILAAVNKRNIDGAGSKVDVAMLDCQISVLENAIARYFATNESPKPVGNKHSTVVPFETFNTKDNKIMIAVANDNLWAKFCKGIKREDLIEHEKFKTNQLRFENYDELKTILDKELIKENAKYWDKKFNDLGVPVSPIYNIEMAVNNEQVISRNMIQTVNHKKAGEIKVTGIPIKINGCSDTIEKSPPLLGEHTEEILKEYLDIQKEEYEKLLEEKVF